MTYRDFLEQIPVLVQEKLGKEMQVCMHTLWKNNNVKKDVLCILERGSNVSPTIYLMPFYEKIENGASMEDVLDEILMEYHINRCGKYLDVDEFRNFDRMKRYVVYKVLNYEKNQELLQTVPHRRYLDLAVVYYLIIENHFIGSGTALIHNQLLDSWGVSEETLYHLAFENTDRQLGTSVMPMQQVIRTLLKQDVMYQLAAATDGGSEAEKEAEVLTDQILKSLLPDRPHKMFVMSNRDRYLGASTILNQKRLADFAAEQGTGFYVIPSSIHEVILVPETEPLTKRELERMLLDINEAGEECEEFLSSEVYYFDRETDCLTM